ncbi:MAG TPA: beta-galactosidase domain 4-containing protein, partial [Bacteroidales bacterium]
MFNSMGSLSDYSEVFDNNPEILGGAIWEYQDQALWNRRNPEHPILAYGGGFGEAPNDHYFIHKGVVSYDRATEGSHVKPHYPEMKKAFQWISTNLNEPEIGSVWINNKFQFISLDGFEGVWSLTENGIGIERGTFQIPHISPRSGRWSTIPYKIEHPKPGAEYFLRISYVQKEKTLWADKGFEIASEQFKLPVKTMPVSEPKVTQAVKLSQNDQIIKISGNGFSVAFNKKNGYLTQLERNSINVLADEGSPKLYLYRAPHQTDDWWADRVWNRYGVNAMTYSLVDIKAETVDNTSVKVTVTVKADGKEGFGAYHTACYLIKGDGSIKVDNKVQFLGMRINLARIGVRMLLDKKLDQAKYFGRGPIENYSDRKNAQEVGIYNLDVNNQYEYEKPMERGNHEDVRWLKFVGKNMPSLLVKADENMMQFSALPHTDEQMDPVEYKIDLPASTATVFCLSTKTMGVGSASCGPRPLEKYQVWSDDSQFSYTLNILQD